MTDYPPEPPPSYSMQRQEYDQERRAYCLTVARSCLMGRAAFSSVNGPTPQALVEVARWVYLGEGESRVEIGGQTMTESQFRAARAPLLRDLNEWGSAEAQDTPMPSYPTSPDMTATVVVNDVNAVTIEGGF